MPISAHPNDVSHDFDAGESLVTVTDPQRFAGWSFAVTVDERGRVVRLGVEPSAGTELTSTDLQRVRLDTMRKVAAVAAATALQASPAGLHMSPGLERELLTRADRVRRRSQEGAKDDVWYAAFAARYVELLPLGAPGPRLAAEYHASHGYVRYLVNQCRPKARNMLTEPPKRGLPGGDLTEKARRILMSSSEEG